jgi:hypothetical protein
MPSDELLTAMGKYNDELKDAGVLLDLAGLHPSGEGKRVRFSGGERSVVDGPFGEKDAIAGYWVLQVQSMDEAVGWASRLPFEALVSLPTRSWWTHSATGRPAGHSRSRARTTPSCS